jgi:preprotein translocase subunit SecY
MKKVRSLTKFIVFSFVILIIYTIAASIIFCKTGAEMTTLTTCFFSTFGGEVLACAVIKIFKLKEKKDGESFD